MALKADRNELDVDISFFYNEGTATRGGIVVIDTVGSGAAMDQARAKVKYVNILMGIRTKCKKVVKLPFLKKEPLLPTW